MVGTKHLQFFTLMIMPLNLRTKVKERSTLSDAKDTINIVEEKSK